jgi:hypothetical protein
MKNDYNFPNKSSKKIQSFFTKYEFVQMYKILANSMFHLEK